MLRCRRGSLAASLQCRRDETPYGSVIVKLMGIAMGEQGEALRPIHDHTIDEFAIHEMLP